MTGASSTRVIVRAYHEARFRGDVAGALAQVSESSFTFRSSLMATNDAVGHLAGLASSSEW